MTIQAAKVEFFCGTGGVGKTTLAAARALQLASENKKVLLITIDPARRLRQLLNLEDNSIGNAVPVKELSEENLFAMILSTKETFRRLCEKHLTPQVMDNKIIQILTKPFAGLNEIMALVEIDQQHESNKFEHIIVDTPPGQHFFDFLGSAKKINQFFNRTYIEIFKSMTEETTAKGFFQAPRKLLQKAIQTGLDKILHYLEMVTGAQFMQSFIDAIKGMYLLQDSFTHAIQFESRLSDPGMSQTFLVTSVDQLKTSQAIENFQDNQDLYPGSVIVLINKTQENLWKSWNRPQGIHEKVKAYQDHILHNEKVMHEEMSKTFRQQLSFSEININNTKEQVAGLATEWEHHEL